jgi:hypothetical protein
VLRGPLSVADGVLPGGAVAAVGQRPGERLDLLDAVVDQRARMRLAALVGLVGGVGREVEGRFAGAVVEDRGDELAVLVDRPCGRSPSAAMMYPARAPGPRFLGTPGSPSM